MFHNATAATRWGFGWNSVQVKCASERPFQPVHPHTTHSCDNSTISASVKVDYATATFSCGEWTVASTVQPVARHVGGVSRNLDIRVSGVHFAHGILGQNLDPARSRDGTIDTYPRDGEYTTRAQADGAIEGTYMDYMIETPFSTRFAYAMFEPDAPHDGLLYRTASPARERSNATASM